MAKRRNWEEGLDDSIQFLYKEGSHIFCMKDGFTFKLHYSRWPPKRLSENNCTTPTEYCKFQISEIHGDMYDLSKLVYISTHKKVTIICHLHGEVEISPANIKSGRGCPSCGNASITGIPRSNSGEFIRKAVSVHGNIYDYSLVDYQLAREKVSIVCRTHGVFEQKPSNHLLGRGCKLCGVEATKRWAAANGVKTHTRTYFIDLSKGVATLYLIKCFDDGELFYKVGITTQTTEKRFRSTRLPYNYSVEHEHTGEAGLVWDLETLLHREYKSVKYIQEKEFGGMHECFSYIDVDEYKKLLETLT